MSSFVEFLFQILIYGCVYVNAGEEAFFKKHLPPHKTTPINTNLSKKETPLKKVSPNI